MYQLPKFILQKFAVLLLIMPLSLHGQHRVTLSEYIQTYKYIAIAEMRESGIPASIKMAQAILESGFGNSELAVNANNHFGIKCHGWHGLTYSYTDDEPDECFRKYDDPVQSFYDHTLFLTNRPRYSFLFDYNMMDYEAWAYGLSRAGYATNPRYPQLLINLIREHDLARLDRKAMDAGFVVADHVPENQLVKQPAKVSRSSNTTDVAFRQREYGTYNRIKYIVASQGDTPQSLERELDIRAWQIRRYNDLENDKDMQPGQKVFLQPKRRKGGAEYHIAQANDSMASISQQYGIRIENLYRRNNMIYGMEPIMGQKILLRGYQGSALQYLFRRP